MSIKFTISVPTFNRCDLLRRNLKHLEQINFDRKEFEIIIVDDGSSDGTDSMVQNYVKTSTLDIRYITKTNGGKYTALNCAIENARGFFFINCDSDDYLEPDCLTKFYDIWLNNKLENIAGIIGHNFDLSKNNVSGSLFPKDVMLSDPIEMRFRYNIKGDKIPCIRTSIMKEFKFPSVVEKTRFIPESYIFYGISKQYKFLYVNEIFQTCEYQSTGLTQNIQKYRIHNSYGCYLAYRRYIELFGLQKSFIGYIRNYINYVRFSFHVKNYRIKFNNLLDPALIIIGFFVYFADLNKK